MRISKVYYHFEPGDVACGATYTYTYSQMPVFIDLYQSAPNANGQIVACNPTDSLAHEIGHVLGLGHTSSDACVGEIMGRAIDGQPRSVMSGDCATADQNWYTPEEYDQDHINDSCYQECRGSCDQGVCTDSTPSPILIDLAGNGYHLTGLAGGVHFDLDADAEAEATSWTRDGSNAFLCLDRNGNGIIENGQELFGNYTVLSNGSRAQNGYEALAEYDQPALGGNGDGWIDPDDAIWPFLRVWADDNHDGISQSHELSSLDAAGIVRIDTHYFTSRRRDQYGNQFRYRGRCVILGKGGAEREHMTYDVFFATRDSPH